MYPRIQLFHRLMSPEQCARVIALAEDKMQPSTPQLDEARLAAGLGGVRDSYDTFLSAGDDPNRQVRADTSVIVVALRAQLCGRCNVRGYNARFVVAVHIVKTQAIAAIMRRFFCTVYRQGSLHLWQKLWQNNLQTYMEVGLQFLVFLTHPWLNARGDH